MRLLLLSILLSCMMLSCTSNTPVSTKPSLTDTTALFKVFIKKFPVRQLPILKQYCKNEYDEKDLILLSESDSIFTERYCSSCYGWGMLPDTLKYYYLLWTVPGDGMVPMLGIFEKNGKRIKIEYILSGRCDCGGPCYTCKDYLEIKEDYSIFAVDTFWSEECDSAYYGADKFKTKMSVIYKRGKIYDGKVEMSEEITKNL